MTDEERVKRNAANRRWRSRNLEAERARSREYGRRNRPKILASRYGVSDDFREALWIAQDKKCAVCRSGIELVGRWKTHLDHDHASGKIRGLLCRWCNLAIGHAKDSITLLRAMADYLEKYL
jgi:hypothetical protein